MTAAEFREAALGLLGVAEKAHRGHPDFRVGDRIIATLGYPDEGRGMVKLTPEQQAAIIAAAPLAFAAAKGAWGRQGSTLVRLELVDAALAASALRMAWENAASG